jgi:acyl-homoserine-lactone acylase
VAWLACAPMRHQPVRLTACLLSLALVAAACSDDDDDSTDTTTEPTTAVTEPAPAETAPAATDAPATTEAPNEPELTYAATIRRTADNVPHVVADDWGSLGYGYGFAFAEDHACSLADAVVQARSQAAAAHGAGPDDKWIDQDLVYLALDLYEQARADFDAQEPDLQDIIRGYAAGYNRYLADTGVDALPGYCAGADWVTPIDEFDLSAYFKMLALRASVDPLKTYMARATPPAADAAVTTDAEGASFELPGTEATQMASNAWAIGPDRTSDGTTMLVGNPHFPWQGLLRFYEVHLTIPGELDVYGASLLGSPAVNIGFTEGVAWSHTVSAGSRFTAYTLDLVPGDPTSYVYGDEVRQMTSTEVSAEVLLDDGSTETVTRTLWSSHYGPIIDFPGVGWTPETTITFRDANADNDELIAQFAAMNRATTMDELIDAHATWQGIPWVNTIAASADGRIWYADTSATPNLSPEAIAAWEQAIVDDPITKLAADNRVVLLDGSDPMFEWVDDPAARDPGVVPFDAMPQLERTDYVFNANDPYWIANPAEPLTGFSPLHGRSESPLSTRTRGNIAQLEVDGGDAGDDGLFTSDELRASAVGNRVFTAEALLDEVLGTCAVIDSSVGPQCAVLREWDRRVDLESVGAALWREFIESFGAADLVGAGALWATPFDPADPVGTPSGLSPDADLVGRLTAATDRLRAAGFDIDTPLGDVQFADRDGERIPVHGGGGAEGVSNVVGYGSNTTSAEPGIERGAVIEGSRTLTDRGYPIANGTSFIYQLEFTDGGPVAQGFVTYGHSGDPTSPFFTDDTRRFSAKDWRPLRFTDDDIAADPALREYTVGE